MPLPLYLELKEFMGLSIDAGVMEPSLVPSIEVIVPLREEKEDEMELVFIDKSASARSNTFPLNIPLYEALCGVEGTVAWTAGPRAAL